MRLAHGFDLPQQMARDMYLTLKRALDGNNDSTRRSWATHLTSSYTTFSSVDGPSYSPWPPVDYVLTLADQMNVPPAVAWKMYATLDRQLTDEDESERYGAIRSVERLMTKLDVPQSTIIRLTELSVRDASAPVRKRATECVAQIGARLEAQARGARHELGTTTRSGCAGG